MGKGWHDDPRDGQRRTVRKAAHRDTPPVDDMYRGRSPGLRVITAVRLPEVSASVTSMDDGSPPTVAGAASAWAHRAPSPYSLLATGRITRRTTMEVTIAALVSRVNHRKRFYVIEPVYPFQGSERDRFGSPSCIPSERRRRGSSASRSSTMRMARSRISAENSFVVLRMSAPLSQKLEPPENQARLNVGNEVRSLFCLSLHTH